MQLRNTRQRFGVIAQLFHWSIAAAFIGAYVFVYYALWVFHDNKNPSFLPTLNVHWMLGVLVGCLVIPRLIWRWLGEQPEAVPGSRLEHQLAHWAHVGLYGLMIVMPLTGYIGTRHYTDYFIFQVPSFKDTALFEWISTTWNLSWTEFEEPIDVVHHFIGKWVAWVVVGLHIAAAFFHHLVRRDATLRRMLPLRNATGD